MHKLKTMALVSLAWLFILATDGPATASNICHTTLTSGSGATFFRFCISNHGNLLTFEAPLGNDHIAAEGYALCHANATTVDGYDTGGSEAGCGAPTITQPNGANTLPLSITRSCGCLRLKQDFARDTPERDVTITMTVTNICTATLQNVYVSRYFDGTHRPDLRHLPFCAGRAVYRLGTAQWESGRV
jgi:hypothetical protein